MFKLIKIIFNACLIVLAFIGFNAIGGQKYVEAIKSKITNYIQERTDENIKKIGDFSKLNQEFQIDNAVNIVGYKAVLAEHKASGQKMIIIDTGKKVLLSENDIKGNNVDVKLKNLAEKFKYQAITVKDIQITDRGNINIFSQSVPYAKFEAKVTKLPFSEITGIVASINTNNNDKKIFLSLSEKKKYSQLITNEFCKGVK